jgi:hypothetical protein
MELLKNIHKNYITLYLCKKSRFDGRFLVLLCLGFYFLLIFSASSFLNIKYYEFWKKLGVPAREDLFADLRVVTSGNECYRLGYNVYIKNPCNPFFHLGAFNYPKIWLSFSQLGLNQSHTFPIAIIIIVFFLVTFFLFIGRLNYAEGLIYSAILCSSSVMLAMERANNDLIIFIILALVIIFLTKRAKIIHYVSYFLLLFASILKIYPIFAFTLLIRESPKKLLRLGCILITSFTLYLVSELNNIKLVFQNTPQVTFWSYGSKIIFITLIKDVKSFLKKIGIDKKYLYDLIPDLNMGKPLLLKLLAITLVGLLIIIGLLILRNFLSWNRFKLQVEYFNNHLDRQFIDSFRVGASIYLGTFLFSNNWAYRLIFLIFVIPQLLNWIRIRGLFGLLSSFSLICIFLTLWIKTFTEGLGFYVDQISNWFLFLYFLYSLSNTLPKWLQKRTLAILKISQNT